MPFTVGSIPQRAGRSIPGMRFRMSTAEAIVAPVFPALTTASASPRFTSSVATPMDVSVRRRSSDDGCSCISTTSRASTTVIPGRGAVPSAARTDSSRPTRTMSATPPSARYSNAPRTISSGAWSPPIASTAMRISSALRGGGALLRADLDHLAAPVHPAMRAGLMRRLRALALRAGHQALRHEAEVAAPVSLRGVRGPLFRFAGQFGTPIDYFLNDCRWA